MIRNAYENKLEFLYIHGKAPHTVASNEGHGKGVILENPADFLSQDA